MVEDEPGLVVTLQDRLQSEGYSVEAVQDGETALERVAHDYFDLILLDIMLPGKNGIDVCRDMRQHCIASPILMLTARTQMIDKVLGLKIGADDYITKPFEMQELLARIEAHLRRSHSGVSGPGAIYQFGPVRVDIRRAEVFRDGSLVTLSAREFQLLKYFIEHRGATIPRSELLKEVWGYDETPMTRTVDVHVFSLRQKLENDPRNPQFIQTVIGLGYKFLG